jgi:hypothetical protein
LKYRDPYRDLQIGLGFDILEEQMRPYREMQERLRSLAEPTASVSAAIASIEKMHRDLTAGFELRTLPGMDIMGSELLKTQEAMAASIRPFLDIVGMDILGTSRALAFNEGINQAIQQAAFLAELTLEADTPEGDDETPTAQETEAQLVKVVPAEALEKLRQVEFLPLIELDRVVRNPELMQRFSGRKFEEFVAMLVEKLGFEDVVLTSRSGDQGRDVLAVKKVHGISILFAFECKRYTDPVGPEFARALLGTIVHGATRANKGVLVTTSRFTPATRKFILTEPSLDGRDYDGLVEWLHEYASKGARPPRG